MPVFGNWGTGMSCHSAMRNAGGGRTFTVAGLLA